MADVRSLLASERASRRINHPHATYSTTGTLFCLICHIQLKSESRWEGHLRSPQHATRLQRVHDGTLDRSPATSAKGLKRKAGADEEGERKRTKAQTQGLSTVSLEDSARDDEEVKVGKASVTTEIASNKGQVTESAPSKLGSDGHTESKLGPSISAVPTVSRSSSTSLKDAIDEDEWAAFERDIATPPNEPSVPSVLRATATISAAPISAEELAATSREAQSIQKKTSVETELEEEKEDARRALEEEFDQMESLEAKLQRLKQKREQLKQMSSRSGAPTISSLNNHVNPVSESDAEGDDEEVEDDFEGWHFRT